MPYSDDTYYEERQEFGPAAVRNYGEVLQQYSYDDYVKRFRVRADRRELASRQRPKLDHDGFSLLMKELTDTMLRSGKENLLANGEHLISKLLLSDLLEEELLS